MSSGKLKKQYRVIYCCICCIFLVSFNATVAGNGCDDKEEVDSESKKITVPKTTRGVLSLKYLSILHSGKCACVCLFYKQSLSEVTKT